MEKDQLSFDLMDEYVVVGIFEGDAIPQHCYFAHTDDGKSFWVTSKQEASRFPARFKDAVIPFLEELEARTNHSIAEYNKIQEKKNKKHDKIFQSYYKVWSKDNEANPDAYVDKMSAMDDKLNQKLGRLGLLPPTQLFNGLKEIPEIRVTFEQL